MGKSVKEKLEEKQKQEHRKYRDELLEDFNCLFEDWKKFANKAHRQRVKSQETAEQKMEKIRKSTLKVAHNLETISETTTQEIEQLKTGRSVKFFVICFMASLLGSLIAKII